MMYKTLRNPAETENGQVGDSIPPDLPAEDEASGKSRRDALAALAKHAAYTAPAVLAILSLTTKRAAAFSF
ncbi:MAG: hypothetical protein ACREC0_15340 [Methylocella sp.]